MTKVPFHFFIYYVFFLRQTYSFSHSVAQCVLKERQRERERVEVNSKQRRFKRAKWSKRRWQRYDDDDIDDYDDGYNDDKENFAVSSFDVLECEIPIKWAQTNWFVSDFYTPHLMLRFHFFSCSFVRSVVCLLACSLSVIFYSASTNAHSLHTVLFLLLLFLFFGSVRWC